MATAVRQNLDGVNFGDLEGGLYVSGGGLTEGDYIWTSLDAVMHDGFKQKGTPRLGVMITLVPKNEPTSEPRQQFYSLGSNSDKSFAPHPNGKGILPIPGASGSTLNSQTNWAILLKSLTDAGLPKGIFTNDLTVLEGMHVHMMNVPEPEERSSFQSKTGDVQAERRAGTIAIVSEILDDGKPWEGTGGIPEAGTTKAKPAAVAGKVKPITGKLSKQPEPEPADEALDDDVLTAALGGLAVVLDGIPKTGTPTAALKLNAAKQVKALNGDDMMSAVVENCYNKPDVLASLLEQLEFKVVGPMVKAK